MCCRRLCCARLWSLFFAPVIAQMANLSFRECRFPAAFKTAHGTASAEEAQSGQGTDVQLPADIEFPTTVSKVIERLVLARLRHLLAPPSFARRITGADIHRQTAVREARRIGDYSSTTTQCASEVLQGSVFGLYCSSQRTCLQLGSSRSLVASHIISVC